MSRLDRLVSTRRQQRDVAADELSRAQKRLQELSEARAEAEAESRAELQRSLNGGTTLSPLDLERLDFERSCSEAAARHGEVAVQRARELALEYHRLLRQVEVLSERIAERDREEENRKERRRLDDIAGRARRAVILPVLLVLAASAQGCHRHKATKPAAMLDGRLPDQGKVSPPASQPASRPASQPAHLDAGVPPTDAEVPTDAVYRDQMVFTLEQLRRLAELRNRVRSMEKREQELVAREKSSSEVKSAAAVAAAATASGVPVVDLVRVLREMNKRAAAAMLAEMDPNIAAAALRQLTPTQVAGILAGMPPDRAAPLAARLNPTERNKPVLNRDGGAAKSRHGNNDAGAAARPAATTEQEKHATDAGR